MTEKEQEQLLAHEATYFAFAAQVTKTSSAWFLDSDSIPNYFDANRAIRLRDDGRGVEIIAGEVLAHFRQRGVPAAADVDAVAEAQGVGAELRRRGAMPVSGDTLLMRYRHSEPPQKINPGIRIEEIPHETYTGEAQQWIETVMSDEADSPPDEAAMWRAVAEHEARATDCHLYLAYLRPGMAVGACDLFSWDGWGRVDSVVTHPMFRRRGVATALVSHAVTASLQAGNAVTYLFTEAGGAGEQVYRKLGFELWATNALRRHILW